MRTLVLGATGFIGRALVLALQGARHQITVLARSPARARSLLPAGVEVLDLATELDAAVARADAIVNLAGESIAGRRWTKKRKQLLIDSRIAVTERLTHAIAKRPLTLPVLVSASAVGWYGARGDDELDDHSPPGDGFAAELCRAWETAASKAAAARVVVTRFGIVLGRGGGALEPLRKLARLGLSGPLGGGEQWVSWIHIEDAVAAVLRAIEDPRLDGALAVTSPVPVRQRDLARVLGRALHRPAVLPAPKLAIELALGEAASMLLASQRVVPRKLVNVGGFRHAFPSLDQALADLLDDTVEIERVDRGQLPDTGYLRSRRPRYTLRTRTELDAPIAEVFSFFSSPENLAALTPPDLAFEIDSPPGELSNHTVIDYKIRIAGIPLRWRTRIERWVPGVAFVDSQERGPYRAWWHEHRFAERDGKTIMEDVVHYAPPLGPLGAIANFLIIDRMLRRIFGYRRTAVRLRFAARRPVSSRALA